MYPNRLEYITFYGKRTPKHDLLKTHNFRLNHLNILNFPITLISFITSEAKFEVWKKKLTYSHFLFEYIWHIELLWNRHSAFPTPQFPDSNVFRGTKKNRCLVNLFDVFPQFSNVLPSTPYFRYRVEIFVFSAIKSASTLGNYIQIYFTAMNAQFCQNFEI